MKRKMIFLDVVFDRDRVITNVPHAKVKSGVRDITTTTLETELRLAVIQDEMIRDNVKSKPYEL